MENIEDILKKTVNVKGVNVIISKADAGDMETLRKIGDKINSRNKVDG